jgi:serine/threonine protein phosphatase PrpC
MAQLPAGTDLRLCSAARSHPGMVRRANQDALFAGRRLLAVADGMGGMAAGDLASATVIEALLPLDQEEVATEAVLDTLCAAVVRANARLRGIVEADPAVDGMGTTLTSMLFAGSRMGLAHIGDSRAYLLRDGDFSQLTTDDTYVQMLVDEGRISAEEAANHPHRSVVARALQGRDSQPRYTMRNVVAGDRYLLCSDGLSGVVRADTISTTLREYSDPTECAERLIRLTLRGGAPDNVSVIVADVLAPG